jgi:hypothetical protein
MYKVHRRFVFAAVVAIASLVPLLAQKMPFTEVAPTQKDPLRFSAFAVNMQGGQAGDVEIAVERWTTDEERTMLLGLVAKSTDKMGGQDKLLKALQDIKPRVGFIRTPNSLGWDLKYAWEAKLPDGSRQIVIATDKPVGFLAAASGSRTLDYMFSLVQMQFKPGSDKGEGKLLAQTSLATKNGRLEVEIYGQEPTRLTTITEKNPKVKK